MQCNANPNNNKKSRVICRELWMPVRGHHHHFLLIKDYLFETITELHRKLYESNDIVIQSEDILWRWLQIQWYRRKLRKPNIRPECTK